MMSKKRNLLVVLLLMMVVAAGCGTDDTDEESTDTTAGEAARVTLRLPANEQSGGFPTPYAAIRGPGRLVSTYIFDTLAFPDVTGDPKPWLAKSWESSPDGKTWTFHLRENVKFHDGRPLTSDDVLFTFDYALKGAGAATGVFNSVNYLENYTAPDPTTFVITLKNARPSFLDDIAGTFGLGVLPKHIWSNVTDPAKYQGADALIGSGPYKVQKYDLTTNSFDFVANDDFFLGKPVVKQMQIVPVSDALLAIDRGEIDAARVNNGLIPQAQYDTLSKKLKVLKAAGEFNLALFFNIGKGFPYDQKAFRQGVVYGLNRKDMVDRLLGGRGVVGPAGALGPGNPFLSKTLPSYDHDKTKAGALLDSIDLKDRNGDGLRDKPDGSAFKIPLSVSSSDTDTAQLTKEYLRAVGLDVDINAVDQQTSDARGASGDYEMAIQHFGGLSGDPSGLISRFGSTSTSRSFTRVHGYKSAAFDQVAQQQSSEVDLVKRQQLVNRMQEILADDLPHISLYVPEQITFVDEKKFKAFAYTPGCPPCGATGNKRMLVSGSAEPVPAG